MVAAARHGETELAKRGRELLEAQAAIASPNGSSPRRSHASRDRHSPLEFPWDICSAGTSYHDDGKQTMPMIGVMYISSAGRIG